MGLWQVGVKSFVIPCKYNCYNICIIKILFLSLCRKQEKGRAGAKIRECFSSGFFPGDCLNECSLSGVLPIERKAKTG